MKYYYAYILKDKKTGYTVFFPDFPEATTQGDTIEECLDLGDEALNITLEEYIRERRNVPEPSKLNEVKKKAKAKMKEYAELLDLSFEPLIQFFKASDTSQKPVKITVSFPKSALENIYKKAEQLGLTRSGFLVKAALAYE